MKKESLYVRRCYARIDGNSDLSPYPVYSNVVAPVPCAKLEQVAASGFTIGQCCTFGARGGDSAFLMTGEATYSGDEISPQAQYGYDRFQRAELMHAAAGSEESITKALAAEAVAIDAENSDSSPSDSSSSASVDSE